MLLPCFWQLCASNACLTAINVSWFSTVVFAGFISQSCVNGKPTHVASSTCVQSSDVNVWKNALAHFWLLLLTFMSSE